MRVIRESRHDEYFDSSCAHILKKVKENKQKIRKVTVNEFDMLFQLAGIKSINIRGSGSGSGGSLILCDRLNIINNSYICRTNKNHANCYDNVIGKIRFNCINNGKIKIGLFVCECVNSELRKHELDKRYRIDRFHRRFGEIKYNMFVNYVDDEYYLNFALLIHTKTKIYGGAIADIFSGFIKRYYSVLKERCEYIKVSEYIENKLRQLSI